jgi:transposase-like protein
VDARYEKVGEAGIVRSRAVLIGIGVNWDRRREVLALELANRESESLWRDFLLRLKEPGLAGVEFVVSDGHAGLRWLYDRQSLEEAQPDRAAWLKK